MKLSVPAETFVVPVYVGALTVATPEVVLFKPTAPPKTALTVPDRISYAALLVRVPAPLSVPPVIRKVPMEAVFAPMFSVPPLIV